MVEPKFDNALKIISRVGLIRSKDMKAKGIPREYLKRLSEQKLIEKIGRGVYKSSNTNISEHHSLVEACIRVPRGVICLISALHFHEITTQLPSEIWIAIDNKSRKPKIDGLSLRIVRFSSDSLSSGIEEHTIEGVKIRVYSLAKTIADCFKYRNKIGLDVAIEALQDGWDKNKVSIDDLWKNANICRVSNVMRPYLEILK